MSRRRHLVAYDIADDKRRTRIYKTMLDFGDRLQFSVFLCQLNARELVQLRARLEPHVHHQEDQILIVDLGAVEDDVLANLVVSIGKAFAPPERVFVV